MTRSRIRIKGIEFGLLIPLKFSKCVVGITTRAPTFKEIDEARNTGRLIGMTSEVDHKKDGSALVKEDAIIATKSNRQVRKQSTKGWKLLVQWNLGTSNWIPLSQLKVSNPVEVAEYAKANKIDDEPAFAWWIKEILRKRNIIIAKVKSRYLRTTHKFGIKLPKTHPYGHLRSPCRPSWCFLVAVC